MTAITKEQTQKIIDAADEVITALAGTNDDVHPDNSAKMCGLWDELNDRYAPPEVVRELARIALASLEAEPVAWVCGEKIILFNPDTVEAYAKHAEISPKPLYAAPPAQDVLAKAFILAIEKEQDRLFGEDYLMDSKDCIDVIREELERLNACRAAMLHAGNGDTNGKQLTITLPDITSKAFWSGTGKSETFHPEAYKRWVKEAIERACVITGIRVVVK